MHNRIVAHNWRANVDMQIILDKKAAIRYMVKYATKGEKASLSLSNLYKSVLNNAKDDDNPTTKLRSLMLKSIAGNRDIGQSEVCRLLLSEPLYSSSFSYVYLSLDINSKQIKITNNDEDNITSKSLTDYFANRYNDSIVKDELDNIFNIIDFAKIFSVKKDKLVKNPSPELIVVITRPTVKFIPNDINKHKDYCYYQMIKYSNWNLNNQNQLLDKNNSVSIWTEFLLNAPESVKNSIR